MRDYNSNGWKLLFMQIMHDRGFTCGISYGHQKQSPYSTKVLYWTKDNEIFNFVIEDNIISFVWERGVNDLLDFKSNA